MQVSNEKESPGNYSSKKRRRMFCPFHRHAQMQNTIKQLLSQSFHSFTSLEVAGSVDATIWVVVALRAGSLFFLWEIILG